MDHFYWKYLYTFGTLVDVSSKQANNHFKNKKKEQIY